MRNKRKYQKLSHHFSRRDFLYHGEDGAAKLRISLGLIGGLELLRSRANNRITIIKGYIDPNSINGKQFKKDYHTLGLAADIRIENVSLKDTFLLAQSIPEFKGIGINLDHDHVHVDTRKEETQYCWITDKDKTIDLNDEALAKYFPDQSHDTE